MAARAAGIKPAACNAAKLIAALNKPLGAVPSMATASVSTAAAGKPVGGINLPCTLSPVPT